MPGAWTPVIPPRPLTDWEARVVAQLHPDATPEQIGGLRVIDRCTCGCSSVGFSHVEHFVMTEAEMPDVDGTPIWLMLFADRERETLVTLDVLRADGQPIQTLPDPESLVVTNR